MARLLVEAIFLVQKSALTKAFGTFRTSIQIVVALDQSSIHSGLGRAVRPLSSPNWKEPTYATTGPDIDEAQRLAIVGTLFRQNLRVGFVLLYPTAAYPGAVYRNLRVLTTSYSVRKAYPKTLLTNGRTNAIKNSPPPAIAIGFASDSATAGSFVQMGHQPHSFPSQRR